MNLALSFANDGSVRGSVDVLPLGIAANEINVLQRMFSLTTARPLNYRLISSDSHADAQVYLVDGDQPASVEAWRNRQSKHRILTVFVGAAIAEGEWPAIRRPLLLPRVLTALDDVMRAEAGRRAAPAPLAPPRVLVVDDSQPVRAYMQQALTTYDIAPDFAVTGEEALLHTFERHFHLVFLDVVMPGIDGYEVCRQIRQRKHHGKPTRVVMLTSRDRAFDKIKGALAGCDAYLTKPVDSARLQQMITQFLAEHRASASAGAR
jgi:two-component system, cell cycle response regulator